MTGGTMDVTAKNSSLSTLVILTYLQSLRHTSVLFRLIQKSIHCPLNLKRLAKELTTQDGQKPVTHDQLQLWFRVLGLWQTVHWKEGSQLQWNSGENIYKKKGAGYSYRRELRQSKFVISPSGLGYDTYCSWEAIMLGAIPVLEIYYQNDSFYNVYDELPVLWVDHYNMWHQRCWKMHIQILYQSTYVQVWEADQTIWIDLVFSYVGS